MIGFAVFSSFNRFTTIFVCVLLCVVYLLSYASGEYDGRDSSSSSNNDRAPSNEFGSCTDGKCIKRTSQDITSGMWFGPRLGRRRRADRKPEINSDIEALANAFEEPHWAIVTIPETEKRQITQFTPRLGRESGEEYFSYGLPKDQEDLYTEEQIFLPLFASRLGRRVPWTPSPRLGRQLHNIIDKPYVLFLSALIVNGYLSKERQKVNLYLLPVFPSFMVTTAVYAATWPMVVPVEELHA